MIDLKERYNQLLTRYYKGCDYLKVHKNEWDKYYPTLLEILKEMNQILIILNITDEEQKLYGIK